MTLLPRRDPADLPLAAVVAAVAAFVLCLFAKGVLNDGDTFWHIRAGEWMLDHRAVLHRDIFSFTMAGAPWSTHEWFAEILLALAWRGGGWSGVLILTGLAFGGAVLIVGRQLGRSLGGVALLVLLVLMIGCSTPSLVARPHILALPLLAAWTVLLVRARAADEAPPLIGALLIAVWANLHGGYFFGLALAAGFALDALVSASPAKRLIVVRDWAVFGALSGLAAFATPHGLDGVLFPIKLLGMSALDSISEWLPADFSKPDTFQIALLLLIGFALLRPLRLPPVRALLLVGLIYMSLSHVRHQLLFAVIAPMLLAEPLRQAIGAEPPAKAPRWTAPLLAACVAALAALRLFALPATLPESLTAPRAVADALPRALLGRPVLNAYEYGGYLIWIGGRPFIDGRADMFGDDYFRRFSALADGDPEALDEALRRWKIEWTIAPAGSPIVKLMDRRPGWRRLTANATTVVHVQAGQAPSH